MAFGKDKGGNTGDNQDFKRKTKRRLIEDRFPGFFENALKIAIDMGQFDEDSIHRVNLGDDKVAVYFTDGSTCEINPDKEKIFVYGQASVARKFADLAAELYFPWGANENAVNEVEGSLRESGKKPLLKVVEAGNKEPSEKEAEAVGPKSRDNSSYDMSVVAKAWRSAGFSDVESAADVVVVSIGRRRKLKDFGSSVEVFGKGKEKDIAKALIRKAMIDWDGVIRVDGPQKLKDACWLEAQRRGATVVDYEPSAAVLSRWNLEKAMKSKLPLRAGSIEHVASVSDGRPFVAEDKPAETLVEALEGSEPQPELVSEPVPQPKADVSPTKTASKQSSNPMDMFNSIRPMHEVMPSLYKSDEDDDVEDLSPTV